jgi:hypothetical protein
MATAAFIKQLQEENWDLKWENLRLKEEIRKLAGTDHAPRSNRVCWSIFLLKSSGILLYSSLLDYLFTEVYWTTSYSSLLDCFSRKTIGLLSYWSLLDYLCYLHTQAC